MSSPEKPTALVERREEANEAPVTDKDLSLDAAARGQGLDGYEDLGPWQTIKTFKMNSLICLLAGLSSATEGYQIGLIGSLVANKGFIQTFGTITDASGNTALASSVMSTWGVVGTAGQIIGMMGLPFLTDRFGRKASMYLYWTFLALSVLVECVTTSWRVWFISKILGGLGVGCMQATLPSYLSEVAPPRARGIFLTNYSLWWIIGQFFAPVALQILNKQDPYNYRTPIYTQWGQIGLMLAIYVFIPESPVWCVNRGKAERARKALRFINKGVPDFDIDRAYHLLEINIEHERAVAAEQRSEKWWAIFKGTNGKRTLISCWTLLTQQVIGLHVFFTYGTYFFQRAGMADPFMITCITSGINIAVSIAVIFVSDVFGRRLLACVGTSVCILCNVGVGILGVTPRVGASNYLLVLFACIWNVGLVSSAAAGWGYIGEISSARLRHYTSGFAAAANGLFSLPLSFLVPYMLNENDWNWGLKTTWFFAGVGLPFTVAMWFLLPETKGRSSAELDELFERKIKPWRFHKTETVTSRMVAAGKVEQE